MSDSATPARVIGLSDVVDLDHTCAIDTSGGAWCWGNGPYLRNDAGASTTESTPLRLSIPPAKRVSVSFDVGCAVVDHGILCWGRNRHAQLGPLDSTPASAVLPPRSIAMLPGAPIRNIAVGNASFALREDGTLLTWGASPPLARDSSLSPDPYPLPIALRGISSMDLVDDKACATAAGIGYCWGVVIQGSDGFTRPLPEPVVTPEPIVQIATTVTTYNDPPRWCAVGASGAVYCWGYNASGQAGDGTKDHAFEAVEVQGLPGPAAEVKATSDTTCALLTSGKVYCWGSNYYGQLGNGKYKVPSLVPEEVVLP